MIRTVLVCNDRAGFERLEGALSQVAGVHIVGRVGWRRPAGRAIEALQPDLIFVDEPHRTPLPLAVIREARIAAPAAALIARAAEPPATWLAEALLAGATVVLPAVADRATLAVVIGEALEIRSTRGEAVRLDWAA